MLICYTINKPDRHMTFSQFLPFLEFSWYVVKLLNTRYPIVMRPGLGPGGYEQRCLAYK